LIDRGQGVGSPPCKTQRSPPQSIGAKALTAMKKT
jgi:hypothetical protein